MNEATILALILSLTELGIRLSTDRTEEELGPYLEIRRQVRKALVAEANRPVGGSA